MVYKQISTAESTILSEMVCMAVFGDKDPKAPTDEIRDKDIMVAQFAKQAKK
jgi:hypothetical protein